MSDFFKNGQLLGLFFIAVIATALLFQTNWQQTEEASDRTLLPGLQDQLDSVSEIAVESPGGRVSVVKGSDGNWQVSSFAGYLADFEQISTLLRSLAKLEWEEAKTNRAENHGRLEVDGAGTVLTLVLPSSEIGLVVGKQAESRGHFVRRIEEDQVYLLAEPLNVPLTSMDWVNPVIIDLDPVDVARVSLETAEGTVTGTRSESGAFMLNDLPEGRELRFATAPDSLSRLLANLRFESVTEAAGKPPTDASLASFLLQSGDMLNAQTWKAGDNHFLQFDREDLKPWVYEISEYTFGEFNKSLEDLLKPLAANEEE